MCNAKSVEYAFKFVNFAVFHPQLLLFKQFYAAFLEVEIPLYWWHYR